MAYDEQTWANEPTHTSPISAERLAHMEQGIENADAGALPPTAQALRSLDMGSEAVKDGLRLIGATGTPAGQIFMVTDHNGAPIFAIGVAGGPAVFGDNFRVFAGGEVFNHEISLRLDGTGQFRRGDPGGGVGVLALGAATTPPSRDPDGSLNLQGSDTILGNVLWVDVQGRLWSRRGTGPTDLVGGSYQSIFPPTVGLQPGDYWFNTGNKSLNFYDGTLWQQVAVDIHAKRVVAGSYTLVNADSYGVILHSSAGSAVTITLPSDATANGIPQEVQIPWRQYGAGQITFAAGSGATLISRGSRFKSAGQYAEGTVTKVDVNTWLIAGDTTT
jgi:hypothetical protein